MLEVARLVGDVVGFTDMLGDRLGRNDGFLEGIDVGMSVGALGKVVGFCDGIIGRFHRWCHIRLFRFC